MEASLKFVVFLLMIWNVQPLGARQQGLWTLDISHDDKYIAVGGDDSLLRIFTRDSGLYKSFKPANKGMIRAVSWHPSENILAVAAKNDVWIFDPVSGKERMLDGAHGGSRTIAWNYNGELLGSAGGGGVVWIWDRKGQVRKKMQKNDEAGNKDTRDFLGIDWHPSKNLLVTVGDEIRIFDTTGKQLKVFRHRNKMAGILTVKWHPSGAFFVTGDYGHPNEGISNLLQFWNTDGGLIWQWDGSIKEFRNIRWNKEGTQLATGSDALRIWDKNGKLLYTGAIDKGSVLWGVDWTRDSNTIYTVTFNNGKIQTWDNKANLIHTHF